MPQVRVVGKVVPEICSRTRILQRALWLSASFKQVAGCLPSCLPSQRSISSAITVQSQLVAINALSPPPQVTQVLCCKNTVGHLKHTANDRHHEAIKVRRLVGGGWWAGAGGRELVGGGWREGLGLPSRSRLPWRLQELSEN